MKKKTLYFKAFISLLILGLTTTWVLKSDLFQSDLQKTTPSLSESDNSLNFIVLGDWGKRGSPLQRSVAKQMGLYGTKYQASFVISTGDNFYLHGVESIEDPKWDLAYEEVYTAPSLQIPWYITLGNHDYVGNIQAQIDYSNKSNRWHFPQRYYSLEKKLNSSHSVQFVFIDTNPFIKLYHTREAFKENLEGQNIEKQLQWLDNVLLKSKADWKIVIGHHPIYSAGPKYGNTPELIEHLEPILQKHGVQTYLCGHEHNLQHIQMNGIDFFISGTGCKARKTGKGPALFSKGVCGFLGMELTANKLTARFFNNKGNQLYSAKIEKP